MPPCEGYRFLVIACRDYQVGLKQNPCTFLLLELLRIFFGRTLFVDMVVLENYLLTEGQKTKTQSQNWLNDMG